MSPTSKSRRYVEVDVFSAKAFFGNPLAVVVDSEYLDTVTMQRIAAWINFSETTFLLPPNDPEADYRVRIFTPRKELPFAGHPSVGSAYVALESGLVAPGKPKLIQECEAGLLPVFVDGEDADRIIRVQAPQATFQDIDDDSLNQLHAALDATSVHTPMFVNNGPGWLICDLGEAETVRGLRPNQKAMAELTESLDAVGIAVFGRDAGDNADADMAVRAFAPADGIPEDPVTGSANAAIAAYLHKAGRLADYGSHYRASQGREIDRNGFVDIEIGDEGTICFGGACTLVVSGKMNT